MNILFLSDSVLFNKIYIYIYNIIVGNYRMNKQNTKTVIQNCYNYTL